MEYAIVEAAAASELQDKVAARLAAGWVPAGGVAVCHHGNGGWHFCQAVVRPPADDE